MSQNSEPTGRSDGRAPDSDAGPAAVRAPRRGRSRSSVITSELEALRPASGRRVPEMDTANETRVFAPPGARPARRVGPPPAASRRRRRPRQPRPSFRGPRLADFIGWWRRLRSVVFLVVITVMLGMILAAIVAVAIGAIVVTIQHALKSSG
jgi:hypothetical protein